MLLDRPSFFARFSPFARSRPVVRPLALLCLASLAGGLSSACGGQSGAEARSPVSSTAVSDGTVSPGAVSKDADSSNADPSFSWQPTARESLAERFPPPSGYVRVPLPSNHFGAWLRRLPLRPKGTPVHLFDGRPKVDRPIRRAGRSGSEIHAAVVDLDVGSRDLQQCADAIVRLRAEWAWSTGCRDEIAFDFTSGDRAWWSAWAAGERPRVSGNRVTWGAEARPDDSYSSFRRYLDQVFVYAGSASLERELEPVADVARIEPGDVFVEGGFPGHAVLVLDVVVDERGHRRFLLGQSYMPAQDFHVLRNPREASSPWFPARPIGRLETPEWTFDYGDARRFPALACEVP